MPRRPVSSSCPVSPPAAIGSHLPAHRRRSPTQADCDTPHRLTRSQPTAYLLPFSQRQPERRPLRTSHRTTKPRPQQMSPDRRRRMTQLLTDRPQRITRLEPVLSPGHRLPTRGRRTLAPQGPSHIVENEVARTARRVVGARNGSPTPEDSRSEAWGLPLAGISTLIGVLQVPGTWGSGHPGLSPTHRELSTPTGR